MDPDDAILPDLPRGPALGRALRGWRALRRVKQAHLAEILGCSQPSGSRLEAGERAPSAREAATIRRLLAARLDSAGDRALGELVSRSPAPMHLICDATHRLLALSPARAAYLRAPASELMGRSTWPSATEELAAAEARLGELGWHEAAAPAVEGITRAGGSAEIEIPASRWRWVRMPLSDGRFARIVETLGPA